MKKSLSKMFLEAEKEEADKLKAAPKPSKGKQHLEGVWIVRPGQPIPEQFVDVLKTWSSVRNHPAWKGNPQL